MTYVDLYYFSGLTNLDPDINVRLNVLNLRNIIEGRINMIVQMELG